MMDVNLELAQNELVCGFTTGNNITELWMKRLDLIHPHINGNKYFKLKYNVEAALRLGHKTLLTFGGPWSNHIYSTASAGAEFGLHTIGIIRGEEPKTWSATLLHAKECGMQLEFIERLAYAEKDTEDFKGWLHEQYGSFHLVPEGGSNFLGINGCMEILTDDDKENFDVICCASGTGATAAGLLLSMKENQELLVFPVFKDGAFLRDEILKHLQYFLMDTEAAVALIQRMTVITDYHFGGYGKWNEELLQFIRTFENEHSIPLDQIYTGKMMSGIYDRIKKDPELAGKRILSIHTGGLQGKESLKG